MDTTIKHLTALGLSVKEARVYCALTEIGSGTAYKIAQHANLKRPTVYLILDELRKQGLVGKIPHAKNQIFTAKDPEELIATYEDRLASARRALPELLRLKRTNPPIAAHVFEGRTEMSEALAYRRDELKDGAMEAFYGAPTDGKKIAPMYYEHARALEAQNTHVRVLAPDDPALMQFRKKDKEYGQDVLYLSRDEYLPRASIEVGPNFAKIFLHTSAQALVIESAEFAEFLKQVFELVWKKNRK